MKNFKTNAMLLSLGLLVSGSIMHVAKAAPTESKNPTEKTLITDIKKSLDEVNKNTQFNKTDLWTPVTGQAIAFILKGASTLPASDTLTAAAHAARFFLEVVPTNASQPGKNQTAVEKQNIGQANQYLFTALKNVRNTQYYRSEKIAAKNVFQELEKLLSAVSVKLTSTTPPKAQAVQSQDIFLKNIQATQGAQAQGKTISEAQKDATKQLNTPAPPKTPYSDSATGKAEQEKRDRAAIADAQKRGENTGPNLGETKKQSNTPEKGQLTQTQTKASPAPAGKTAAASAPKPNPTTQKVYSGYKGKLEEERDNGYLDEATYQKLIKDL